MYAYANPNPYAAAYNPESAYQQQAYQKQLAYQQQQQQQLAYQQQQQLAYEQQQQLAYQQQQQLAYQQQQRQAYQQQQQLAYQQQAYQYPAAIAQQVWVPPAQEPSDPKVKNLQILDNVLQSDRPTKKKFRNYLRTICKTRGIRLPGSSNLGILHGLVTTTTAPATAPATAPPVKPAPLTPKSSRPPRRITPKKSSPKKSSPKRSPSGRASSKKGSVTAPPVQIPIPKTAPPVQIPIPKTTPPVQIPIPKTAPPVQIPIPKSTPPVQIPVPKTAPISSFAPLGSTVLKADPLGTTSAAKPPVSSLYSVAAKPAVSYTAPSSYTAPLSYTTGPYIPRPHPKIKTPVYTGITDKELMARYDAGIKADTDRFLAADRELGQRQIQALLDKIKKK